LINTSPNEFEKFLKYLPHTPTLIPIRANGKEPDIPEGESWKDPKHHLTVEQAFQRLEQGKNIGVVAVDWLVIVDLDKPQKYVLPIETLTIETRNGAQHKYFINAGDVENAVGKNTLAKCGEVRAHWQYVLAPGSYVPKDADADKNATGLYHIINELPLATLHKKDLPTDFVPTETENKTLTKEALKKPVTLRNKHGWSLDDIRKRDTKLDTLLNGSDIPYPSASEADMATLSRLLFWDFEENEAVELLKTHRYRDKLKRDDYIVGTLQKISMKKHISDMVDPKKWTPTKGYTINLNFVNVDEEYLTEEGRIDKEAVLNSLLKQFIFITTDDTEEIFYYKDGVYKEAEIKIKERIEKLIQTAANTHFVEECIANIKRRTYISREEFNKHKRLIPVKNGLYNITTNMLEPFDPKKIFTYQIHATYDKNRECPKFQKFLNEVIDRENLPIIQRFLGYTLYPDMPHHKMLWLHGTGRNGKTTLVKILISILGKENITSISIDELNLQFRFTVARLFGKLANISSEPSSRKELETELIKKLAGDDMVSGEKKNKQNTIEFENFAKIIVLGNRFPQVRDITPSFWERLLIVPFPNMFIKNANPNLAHEITTDENEKSGILNFLINGLKLLLEEKGFGESKSTNDIKKEFEKLSDTIIAFFNEQGIKNPQSIIPKETLYNAYKAYCEEQGLTIEGKTKFSQRIAEQPGVKEDRQQIEGKTTRCWRGITVKETQGTKIIAITPILGPCAYCGETRMLSFKDIKGNYICDKCKREA